MKFNEIYTTLVSALGRKIKQNEFCAALNMSPQTVSNRIQRNSDFTTDEINALEKHFNVQLLKSSVEFVSDAAEEKKYEQKSTMNVGQVIQKVAKLAGKSITQADLARIWNCGRGNVSYLVKGNRPVPVNKIKAVEDFYSIKLIDNADTASETVAVLYRPNVYLSAGYGAEVYDESAEMIMLDKRFFISDRGIMINPAHCEIVTIRGNSMAPEYRNGDRVILDKSYTEFTDGQIFAFRYAGECYIKEICLMGKRIKCIPLNKDYDPFFIEPDEEVTIFGRILPRIRL